MGEGTLTIIALLLELGIGIIIGMDIQSKIYCRDRGGIYAAGKCFKYDSELK